MMPLVPGITTSRAIVERTVRAIAEAGAPLAGSGVLHLEDRVRQHFFAFLEREYPGLLDGYRRLYEKAYAPKGYADRIKLLVKSVTTRRRDAPSAP
jgi:DNA repair photolyase